MAGVLIAGMGLPGSGKSSVCKALAEQLIQSEIQTRLYVEPEEQDWPLAVTQRDLAGHITALTWFRSQRVPLLYEADLFRNDGGVAIVDSYYDKLIHVYFDRPGLSWLMARGDAYRPVYKELIALDHERLPNAECVVSFCVAEDRWREFVRGRARVLDRSSNILDTYHTQEDFLNAASQYCMARGIPHVTFQNEQPTAFAAAVVLRAQLKAVGVLK
jgi:thymidylate kinase